VRVQGPVGEAMVAPMVRDPAIDWTPHGPAAQHGQQDTQRRASLEGAVREVAVEPDANRDCGRQKERRECQPRDCGGREPPGQQPDGNPRQWNEDREYAEKPALEPSPFVRDDAELREPEVGSGRHGRSHVSLP
jgi:hypothetical protein